MAQILDGKALAQKVREEAHARAAALQNQGIRVGLAVVLVGDDPASAVYVRNKRKDCSACGIETHDYDLPANTTQEELEELLRKLNQDSAVSGILVQMPLPPHIDAQQAILCISPGKDVDGLHPVNLGRLVLGLPGPRPCTPTGIMRLLRENGIAIAGKEVAVFGRSVLVGKPLLLMMTEADATVTICHSHTPHKEETAQRADIVISAIGRARAVKSNWMREGAVVVDVGINRDENGKLVGDVDYEAVEPIASAITPVPGGVGPMTRAMLMLNTVAAAEQLAGIDAGGWPR